MKKVLALVLTLAMLVGSMAVGLSAAFEFTATENGEKFENVYSMPLESKGSAVTYFSLSSSAFVNPVNIAFDVVFTDEKGFIGDGTYGSPVADTGPHHISITPNKIGIGSNGNATDAINYKFDLYTKYSVAFRQKDAEEGKTIIRVNGQDIGQVTGRVATGWSMVCGANHVIVDNIAVSNGEWTQYEEDFEDGKWSGHGDGSAGAIVNSVEIRRDLGKSYGSATSEGYTFAKVSENYNWKNSDGSFAIEFDISFMPDPATQCELEGAGNSPWMTNTKIGVNTNEAGKYVNYDFKSDEWYHVKYVGTNDATEIYVNGVKVEGSFPAMDGASIAKEGWYFWPEYCKMDNIKIGTAAVIDFEGDQWNKVFEDYAFSQADYVGKKVDIFDNITTYPVEGEATLLEAAGNAKKDPSNDYNSLYLDVEHGAGVVPNQYIVNFDVALYPDKEGTISSDKMKDGAWVEFIVNAMKGGDNDRVKIGNKFLGKNKDLVYYGEGNDLQPWAPGEFHNVTIQVANGAVTVYLDKIEMYSSPVGMDNFEKGFVFYVNNTNAIIDNYRIYDAKTFAKKVDTFNVTTGSDHAKTISDVNAENFCEANGHILSWARTADPKCYENGVNTYKCWNCDYTEAKAEVAKLEHKFEHYDIKRVNDEGLVVTNCKTSAGCTERKYIQLPDADDYTGTIKLFHDFQDDFVKVTSDSIGFEKIEDGVAKYIESDANYNQIGLGRDYSASELNAGTKVGFDFSVNGTFDTDASLGEYGHSFDLYFGKSTVGAATIKYNMDTQKFYISSTNRNFTEVETEDTYELVPGEVYNLEVAFQADMENMTAELAVYLNGEEILRMDEFEAYDYITYFVPEEGDSTPETTINCLLMHVYGVKIEIDNFVIGDYDFGWNRAYAGDVDGDYEITVNDALLMRKYLAKIIDMDELYASRADVNGDGYVDAIDQLRIRKALAD